MSYLDDYKKRMGTHGGSIRASLISSTKRTLLQKFLDSPSYQQVVINESNLPAGVLITNDSQLKEQNIIVSLDEIKTGYLVSWRGSNWIILIVDTYESHWRGVIKKCESSLKWLTSEGLLRETPFSVKSTNSSSMIQEDKIMILSKERRVILIQSNDDTRQIKKDKRFIFDGRCWKVVGYNGLTEGLLELTLEEDLINESNDNLELRIADYFGNTAVYTVRILNGEIATISTFDTLQLVVEVRNKDNTLVNGARVEFDSSNQEVITVSEDGLITPRSEGTAVVTASYKGGSMQMQINVVPMATNNYSVEISGNSEIKFTRSSTYTVTFYNNGLSFTDKALFKLLADDGVSETSLASITSYTDSSCILKANSTMGYVRLKVINQNGLIANEMRIKVKSLI